MLQARSKLDEVTAGAPCNVFVVLNLSCSVICMLNRMRFPPRAIGPLLLMRGSPPTVAQSGDRDWSATRKTPRQLERAFEPLFSPLFPLEQVTFTF